MFLVSSHFGFHLLNFYIFSSSHGFVALLSSSFYYYIIIIILLLLSSSFNFINYYFTVCVFPPPPLSNFVKLALFLLTSPSIIDF